MNAITLVTGNPVKRREAKVVFDEYGIVLEYADVDIDEIQHHDPYKITEAKARAAYAAVGKPVIVNDSQWNIPSLGGFPGGYMKDITAWLSAEDWLALMKGKADRSIILTDVVAYYDGKNYKYFTREWQGVFLENIAGSADHFSFNRVVRNRNKTVSLAEEFDMRATGKQKQPRCEHWIMCATWLAQNK